MSSNNVPHFRQAFYVLVQLTQKGTRSLLLERVYSRLCKRVFLLGGLSILKILHFLWSKMRHL